MEKEKSLSLFSEDTLDSIAMAEVMGGTGANFCQGGNCVTQCACEVTNSQRCSKNGVCAPTKAGHNCGAKNLNCNSVIIPSPGPGFELHPGDPILVLPPGVAPNP